MRNRYLVRFYSGRTILCSREVRTYRHARSLAAGFRHYPATIRLILSDRECALLYALGCVALFALAYVQLGA